MSEDRFSAGASGGREADASPDAAEGPSRESQGRSAPASTAEPTFLERLAGLFRQRNGSSLREDLTDALAGSEEAGTESFSPGERAMLANILRLREVSVEDVMIPRADIESVSVDTSLAELMLVFERSGHSRMPVYKGSLDDPQGMVHIRDVLAHITRAARPPAAAGEARNGAQNGAQNGIDLAAVDLGRTIADLGLIRTVLFVPPSMHASDLMTRMQGSRTQMALVIDEYGGTDGLVSLEDIVETVVGDIEDEHDEEESLVTRTGDDVFVVDGKADIDEVARAVGFTAGEHGDYVDTIGGLVVAALGRVPNRGEVVSVVPGFEFHIVDADPRRVKTVRIVRTGGEPARALPAA